MEINAGETTYLTLQYLCEFCVKLLDYFYMILYLKWIGGLFGWCYSSFCRCSEGTLSKFFAVLNLKTFYFF
jgi:hypothetical protein